MTEPTDLIERLRAEIERKRDAGGDMLYRGVPDPLLAEAADEITALRDRVAALEGALGDIAYCHETVGAMRQKARSILSRAQQEGEA